MVPHSPEPLKGLTEWCPGDVEDIISSCESEAAIGHQAERNRGLLKALSREQRNRDAEVGAAFTSLKVVLLILDVSRGGFRVQVSNDLRVGERVRRCLLKL